MKKTLLIVVVLLAGVTLGIAFNAGASRAFAQDEPPGGWSIPDGPAPVSEAGSLPQGSTPNSADPDSTVAVPGAQMSYQGKLLQNDLPFTGTITLTFRLYADAIGGVAIWTENRVVDVQDGLFSLMLGAVTPISAPSFFTQLYLGIQPAGAASELAPRQKLGAVPYALGLVPGVTVQDSSPAGGYGYTFYVNSFNHKGIYGSSTYTDSIGVRGEATGPWSVSGGPPVGVSGHSTNGYGVQGTSDNSTGVFGQGPNIGIWGQGTRTYSIGVLGYGVNLTGTYGVMGTSAGYNGAGVYGSSSARAGSCDVNSDYCSAAIAGSAYGPNNAGAYGGFFYSAESSSIIGLSDATASSEGWFYNSVEHGAGHTGLYTDSDVYAEGDLIAAGSKTGYVVDIALNSGSQPLQQGDVVAIVGYDTAVLGEIPVVRVALADGTNASAVMGVVDVLYNPCTIPHDQRPVGQDCGGYDHTATTIQPGQYLGVVTLGAFAYLRVDASRGPIHPGDLMTVSATPGLAAAAQMVTVEGVSFYAPGTIVGKALGSLESGSGLIPVFVTLK